jgi:hypothetical protein
MPFKPPASAAFKQFVILDGDGLVAALSAIDGGKIDEILTRSAEEKGGEAGAQIGAGPVQGGGKRAKTRKVEEEVRRARTRHATTATLLDSLHERSSVGIVDGPLDMEVGPQIEAGMVIQFRAELRLHPLHQADQMMRSLIEVAPKFDQKQVAAKLRPILAMWETLGRHRARRFPTAPRTAHLRTAGPEAPDPGAEGALRGRGRGRRG